MANGELAEAEPEKTTIDTALKRFSGILDKMDEGQALYQRVLTVLAGLRKVHL